MTHALGHRVSSASLQMTQNEEWSIPLLVDQCAAIQSPADRVGQQGPHEVQKEVPSPAPGEE